MRLGICLYSFTAYPRLSKYFLTENLRRFVFDASAMFVSTRALVSRREKDLGAEIAKMIKG